MSRALRRWAALRMPRFPSERNARSLGITLALDVDFLNGFAFWIRAGDYDDNALQPYLEMYIFISKKHIHSVT